MFRIIIGTVVAGDQVMQTLLSLSALHNGTLNTNNEQRIRTYLKPQVVLLPHDVENVSHDVVCRCLLWKVFYEGTQHRLNYIHKFPAVKKYFLTEPKHNSRLICFATSFVLCAIRVSAVHQNTYCAQKRFCRKINRELSIVLTFHHEPTHKIFDVAAGKLHVLCGVPFPISHGVF